MVIMSKFPDEHYLTKTRIMGLWRTCNLSLIGLVTISVCDRQTDRQADRQVDRVTMAMELRISLLLSKYTW